MTDITGAKLFAALVDERNRMKLAFEDQKPGAFQSMCALDRVIQYAALSPQALPAPGEVERLVEIAIKADPNREHRDYRLNPIYEEEREQFRPAVRAILATVAAANDEGVASANEYRTDYQIGKADGIEVAAKVADQQRASCNREADSRCLGPERLQWRRAAEEIAMTAAAIRLLSQGEGA